MGNKYNENIICKNKCYWINQGLIYVLIVLITMISTISFLKMLKFGAGDPNFVSMFEFGATLTSIILSVIAIVYTLIQSKQSETVNARIVDASEMVEEHSGILKNSVIQMENEVNLLKEMNLGKTLKEHMDRFDKKLDSLGGVMAGRFDEVAYTLNNVDKLLDGTRTIITEKDKEIALSCINSIFKDTENISGAITYEYILLKLYLAESDGISTEQMADYLIKIRDEVKRIYPVVDLIPERIQRVVGMHYMNILIGFIDATGKLNINKKILIETLLKFKEELNKPEFNKLDSYIENTLNKVT